MVDFAQLYSEQTLRKNFKVNAVWFFSESIGLRRIFQKADVGSLADVLDRLSVWRVVH